MKRPCIDRMIFAIGLVLVTAASASAATVYVASNGTNSMSCGSKTAPCRSITQGIAQAAEGSKVIVGPGVYGDLDSDGSFGDPGDESPGFILSTSCLVPITKKVTVTSASGAWATIIDPGPSAAIHASVCLGAEGIAFGGNGKGFTVRSPGSAATANVRVLSGANGSIVSGILTSCDDPSVNGISVALATVQVLGSRVSGCNLGIFVQANDPVIKGNVASGNVAGFLLAGLNAIFDGNVAVNNDVGLDLHSGNVTKSSFLGNHTVGVALTDGSLTSSNIVGNGTSGAYPNCGIYTLESGPQIGGNWWGAAAGPGADPADIACGSVSASSFADAPFPVKPKAVR